jgi:hypothetical protein
MLRLKRWFLGAPEQQEEQAKEPTAENNAPLYSFDEYKMYFETTVTVTEQRNALNRWNYSVCTAIIVGSGLFLAWASDKPRFFFVVMVSLAVLSASGALFAMYWMRQIKDLKLLNGVKFKVLNEMAPAVKFDDQTISNEPFAKEWVLFTDTDGVRPIKGLGGKLALSSSGAELFVPRAFAALFTIVALGALISLVLVLALPVSRGYLPVSPPSGSPPKTTATPNPSSATAR